MSVRRDFAEEIKSRVTMTDLLNQYGFHLVMGRMPCPFHNGQDRNLSVKRDQFRCFVCGEHGDIFSFVMRYFGLDFPNAMAKINQDFHLGLPIGENEPKRDEKTEREALERKRKVEERKREARELRTRYEEALEAYCDCDIIVMRCRPISPTTGITDVFAWAAKNIDRLWVELKEAEATMFEFEQREGR